MIRTLIALCIFCEGELTVEETDSLFRQNAFQAATLRVEWSRSVASTEAWRDYTIRFGEVTRRQLEAGEVLPERVDLAQQIVQGSLATKIQPLRTIMQDYWSDRRRFQWRVPFDDAKGFEAYGPKPSRVSHPDVQSLPEQLVSTLKDRLIITGSGGAIPFRTWFGGKRADQFYSGAITFEVPVTKGTLEFFPPLALPDADWQGVPSKLDLFARPNPERAMLVGQHKLGSVLTHVMIKSWRRPPKNKNSNAKSWDVIRGFVDADRSGIPLRLEGFAAGEQHLESLFALGTAPLSGEQMPFPTWIVRDVEIEMVSPGFFYPMHGFEDDLGPVPDNAGERPTKLVPHRTVSWHAYRVEANREMSPEMFDLKFPPNTLFKDETSNEARLTGGVDGYADLIVNRTVPRPPTASPWRNPYVWTGVIITIGAVAFGLRLRRDRREK